MGSLIKQFSIVGIVSQVIWSLLLFSSFTVEKVLTNFGELGPIFIGILSLATTIGWLMMVAFLLTNDEIKAKTMWFIALLFLPGQLVFWILFIRDADALEELNDPTFDRNVFIEEYKIAPKPVAPPSTPKRI